MFKDIYDENDSSSVEKDSNLWAVMNTVLDAIIIIDDNGLIKAFNPAAVRLFGYTPEETFNKNVKMLMPEPYCIEHDKYISNYKNTSKAKVIGIGREVFGKRKSGDIFPMELGVNEMHINNKLMFVGMIRDISSRKNAEKEVANYIKALKYSNQELDDFAYIASHDLKEPLRGLSNNAIFLKEDYQNILDKSAIKRLDRMIYLCERMEQLINDLLYFSRLGNQELAVQETDLNSVIRDITTMMESVISENNVLIVIPKKLPSIVCDKLRITEVFRNLITNAIKYNNSSQKIIEIGCNDLGVFYVKDNGIGIDSQYYETIFRIFKRLNEEDDTVKGTGVGLTFVKRIIERHYGNIWVESIINQGTTFYFTINDKKKD